MIKLETKNVAPSAVASLEIRSHGDSASVILGSTDHGGFIDETWVAAIRGKKRQQVTFIGADGLPCTLEGVVEEAEAVEIACAHKVLIQARVSNVLTATKAVGRTSKETTQVEVVRVLEVWDTPQRCLWKAAQTPQNAATMSADGKITKAA